jgi:pyridoxamine 5'-phosphate oxidase
LTESFTELDLDRDPTAQFRLWFASARDAGHPEPEAMALATASASGEPSVRFVLMRGFDERGVVFYTNRQSRKAREITQNPRAAVVFRWKPVERQVRMSGPVAPVDDAEADAYFAGRERGSQLGAWASDQSAPLESRQQLDRQLAEYAERFAGRTVPRPEWWGGYRLTPVEFEFWQQGPNRLHDRFLYTRAGSGWSIQRLYP